MLTNIVKPQLAVSLTIVIISYNRPGKLFACISSITEAFTEINVNLIVVNNASSVPYSLDSFSANIDQYIELQKRTPLLLIRKTMFESVSSDWIMFVDDDCQLAADWIQNIKNIRFSDFDVICGPVLPLKKLPVHERHNWLLGINPKPSFKYLPFVNNCLLRRSFFSSNFFDEITNIISYLPIMPYYEDYKFMCDALRKKARFYFGNMLCYHDIDNDRLQKKNMIKRAFTEGCCTRFYLTTWEIPAFILRSFFKRCLFYRFIILCGFVMSFFCKPQGIYLSSKKA